MIDDLQGMLRIYTRAFVAQGIGIVGLLWCLFDNHPRFGLGLTALVLIDQAVFLRQRFAADAKAVRWQTMLHVWCLGVSLADVLILCAILFQAEGLREIGRNAAVTEPLDFLAFSLASFGRAPSSVAAVTAAGRLLAAVEALAGVAVLLIAGAAILTAMLYRRSAATTPAEPIAVDDPDGELG